MDAWQCPPFGQRKILNVISNKSNRANVYFSKNLANFVPTSCVFLRMLGSLTTIPTFFFWVILQTTNCLEASADNSEVALKYFS